MYCHATFYFGLYASWSTNFDSKNICDETVFSVISNSAILANFTAKWSAKSFICRWKTIQQRKRTHRYTTMKFYSGQFKIQNTYSIFFTQCKSFKKEFKNRHLQVYIGLIFCLFYVLFRMFNLFFFYNSCLWFQFH